MSIRELGGKIKGVGDLSKIWPIVIIIFASTASFGLGRLSSLQNAEDDAIYLPATAGVASVVASTAETAEIANTDTGDTELANSAGSYLASKNGTRYYFPWCSGAKQIKEENKVWFETKEQAETAGFTPAQNCKGL